MYTSFYRLTGLPFQLSPDPRFFFGSSGHEKAMAYLIYGLHQSEGFIVITGEIGAGKTTILDHLLSDLDRERYIAAKVVTTQLDADDTLRMVASAFGIPQEGRDKASLLQRLQEHLGTVHRGGRRSLLLVDEAQNLTARSLEELRMLSNFEVGHQPLLQSFLLGQPQFRTTLAKPGLEQLRQRVIASYHLGPLTPAETRAYIEHRLRTVGWNGDPTFADDAFALIHEETGGVPRRINTLCSRLLLSGFLEESHHIDTPTVQSVARDLSAELHGGPAESLVADAIGVPQPGGLSIASDELLDRVAALERKVLVHDRAIKHTFGIAADYLDRAAKP